MMKVTKRNGETEPLDLAKIHKVLEWACKGNNDDSLTPIKGVSISEIEVKAHLHFRNGIRTKDIHECLIKAAADLISLEYPNYDQVAARLRWFSVRKEAFGTNVPPSLYEIVKLNTKKGIYEPNLINYYSEEEWEAIGDMVDHRRDDLFRYAGAEQMAKKYLAQNRKTKKVFETFQIPFILVSAILFKDYPIETRLNYVKSYYDSLSLHYFSLPTPIMAGLRTRSKQFSSCTVLEVGDSLDSIIAASSAIVKYASNKAGIGCGIGRIRAAGQPVRNGDAVTTGVLPFSKFLAAALKSCSQGAVRGASATFNWPLIHLEYETLIELKNNKGTEETRLRTVDYCVHLNRTMYERLVAKSNITFFTPDEVPDLFDAFYGPADKFKELYEKYEADPKKTKKSLPAVEVFAKIMQERFETGRIYIMNADLVNTMTPFKEPIRMTNLCAEIALPTHPVGEEDEMISLCTLSAINMGKDFTDQKLEEVTDLIVRGLDALLDYQDYPSAAAEYGTKKYRPLGVGVIGFSHFLAKRRLRWGEDTTISAVEAEAERIAYYLTKASVQLAKEQGACPGDTKYHDGIFPWECSSQEVNVTQDWESLRKEMKEHGIRNATLMALMPSETSSQISNATNGFEPPKALISIKGSKDGVMTQVVPDFNKLGPYYETAWQISVPNYLRTVAPFQKFVDQSMSTNTSYNPSKMGGQVSMTTLIGDLILAYKLGIKTLYYNNTLDGSGEEDVDDGGCEGGACKI